MPTATEPIRFDPLALAKARRNAGLSREQLAAEVGRSYGLITQIEQGLKPPSTAVLVAMVNALGVPIGDVFTSEPVE